jgi:hypothetical protein
MEREVIISWQKTGMLFEDQLIYNHLEYAFWENRNWCTTEHFMLYPLFDLQQYNIILRQLI